ncbi:MAG: tryptophan--tRNA ligase [Endomicrobium sp.]|nr:tryptophan--tRNA ligase [Endomicrobium sp.]
MRKRVLSGMRPTGRLHLGHYFGALHNWINFQHDYECYYMSADWHALTTNYVNTSEIDKNTLEMIADWIAVGIDPQKSTLFKQSKILQHSELFLILSMITPLRWLQRCSTYKKQINEDRNENLNGYGFLGYPVLQAADILLYKAHIIPVGKDQLSHLEFTREIMRRFNNFYGKIFVIEPKEALTKIARVPGLDGRKMSKSYNNSILLGENNDILKNKVKSMFTDPLKIRKNTPGHPENCVVFGFYKILDFKCSKKRSEECKIGMIGCVVCKSELVEILTEFMAPLTNERKKLISDKAYLDEILKKGCQKATEIASETMKEIHEALKF